MEIVQKKWKKSFGGDAFKSHYVVWKYTQRNFTEKFKSHYVVWKF